MSSPSPQVVHESETQRQFIRLQLPAIAEIDGHRLTVKDLSSGGMAIRAVGADIKKDKTHDILLILPFGDFTLDIALKVEIQYVDKKLKIAGCRFTDLKPNQISILNHVIRSFVSGEIMDGGEILSVVARENFVNVRKNNEDYSLTMAEKYRTYSLYGLVALAIILVSSFIIGNIMDRLFVMTSSQAQVYVPTITIKNPMNGVFVSSLAEKARTIKKGQEIGQINSPLGNLSSKIISPCDCYIQNLHVLREQYAAQNDPLLTLIDITEKPVIKAYISTENLARISQQTKALITISGILESVEGQVISSSLTPLNSSINGIQTGQVLIAPTSHISIDHYNLPAFVEFHL